MRIEKEQQFLKIIKFTPSIFVIVISLCVILFLYFENKNAFSQEKKDIEEKYILKNKELIKEEVNRVYEFIEYLQKTTEIELKKSVKSRVYEAHAIATGIYEKYKDTKSKEEIFQLIKVSLNNIRFNDGRGYFFMDDIYGNKLSHPVDTSIEGKNFINYTDPKGYKLFEAIVNTIKEKTERFDEYYWYKPNTNKEVARKISFYKYFEPLNIAIGTGEYFDDFEREIQKKALNYISLIKFGNAGYIFVMNYDKVYLNHFNKNFIGKKAEEILDTKDIDKNSTELLNIGKNSEGYYTYIQYQKPNSDFSAKKTSYVKGYEAWKWVIGTGFYEDDVNSEIIEIKKRLEDRI